MIINLLSNPRNISTALMYSFAQRSDMRVFDEPFYANYLLQSGKKHPGDKEIIANGPQSEEDVVFMITMAHAQGQHVFLKNMAHHMRYSSLKWMDACHNILFIRNPGEVLHSFSKVIASPQIEDIAIMDQVKLWRHFRSLGLPCTILDSKDLLQDPGGILAALCDRLEIPFDTTMLSWPTGPKPYDGIWAQHWYDAVHKSSGFAPYEERTLDLYPTLKVVYKTAMPYYLELFQHRLTL